MPPSIPIRAGLLAGLLAAGLGAVPALAQPMERARAAQARGDLRAAQIEYRNAVRAEPGSAAARAALAAVSLDLGDGDTAEKEARAALERGFDPVAGTAMLLRAYLLQNRARELLRDFPLPDDPAKSAVAAQIAAGRARAQLSLGDRGAARRSAAEAVRLGPDLPEPHIAAAGVALAEGDRAAAEAALDRALAVAPDAAEALLRKAGLQFERGEPAVAVETLGRLLAQAPAHVPARIMRAEAFLRMREPAKAREELEAALRVQPGNAAAAYLRAALLVQAQDWRGADESFQRLGALVGNFPEGYLLQALTKRALGQAAQALDAAQRYAARRPEDPRGGKLLASLEMEAKRPGEAAAALGRLIGRGAADAEAFDMLGRAQLAAGRPREAVEALQRAASLAPQDSDILARLAAARLAAGDATGMAEAAQSALRVTPDQAGAREVLAVGALARGDFAAAEAELDRLDPGARRSEAAGIMEGRIRLGRFDLPGARAVFERVLATHPDSLGARLGLARVAAAQNRPEEADRLHGEVLRRAPGNPEAIGGLARVAAAGGPRGTAARAALEAALAAAPGEQRLALVLAALASGAGDNARAIAILEAEPLRQAGRGAALPLVRAQAYAAASRWADAESAVRAALVEEPENAFARRQLAALLIRRGDIRGAETVLQDGLRMRPGDALLQQTLVGLAQHAQGLDAALALAEDLARQPPARPAARLLRGDLLLGAQRPAEAAEAFAKAYAEEPSAVLALRQFQAWRAAGQQDRAVAALQAWLQREPDSPEALGALSQLDLIAGRVPEAERRLTALLARAPDDAAALNNLAWILAERGGEALPRARALAERAYFLMPNPETADTLGWVLARSGDPRAGLPLLRAAAASHAGGQPPDPGMAYRLAYALRAAGEREEAIRVLDPALTGGAAFPERAQAEKLLAELRAGR